MNALLLQLLAGLSGASTLFLAASGLTVIFGVTRVVNFAHGSLAMLGAYIGWSVLTRLPREPWPFLAGTLATALAIAAIGALVELAILRRVYRAPELFQLLATFAVVLIVADLVQAGWGPADLPLPRPRWLRATLPVLGGRLPVYDLALIAVGPVVLLALTLLLRRTRWGVLVRAATLDREMVGALGVDERWLFTSVFALGAGLAGLGGVLSLPNGSANGGIDLSLVVDAFVVVVVGGLGSVSGAFLASLLLGVGQSLGVLFLPQFTLVLFFAVMLVVLVLRPNGLLGRPQAPARSLSHARLVRPGLPGAARRRRGTAAAVRFSLPALGRPLRPRPSPPRTRWSPSSSPPPSTSPWAPAACPPSATPPGSASAPTPPHFAARTLGRAAPRSSPSPLATARRRRSPRALFGLFVARLSGVYLAMITLAGAQIVWAVAFQWVSVTGGDNGLLGVTAGTSARPHLLR